MEWKIVWISIKEVRYGRTKKGGGEIKHLSIETSQTEAEKKEPENEPTFKDSVAFGTTVNHVKIYVGDSE